MRWGYLSQWVLSGVLLVLVGCGMGSAGSLAGYGTGGSNSNGTPNGGGESDPLTWQINTNSSLIFTETAVTVTFPSGISIFSASATGSYVTAYTALGLPLMIEVDVNGNVVSFLGESGEWPLGDVTFTFSALTSNGSANDEVTFTVLDLTTEPAAPPCTAPMSTFPATDKVVYTRIYSLQTSEIFRVDVNTLEVDQLTHDTSQNVDALLDYDGRISFASDRVYGDGNGSDSDWEIYRMDPDGSNLCLVTSDSATNRNPSLSPALDRMTYSGGSNSNFTSDVDGNNESLLVGLNGKANGYPSWCPNNRIVYLQSGVIHLIDADGTNDAAIPGLPTSVSSGVNCCTDGLGTTKIIFSASNQIRVADVDGSNYLSNVTSGRLPDFNEDCTKMVFLRDTTAGSTTTTDVYMADFDGTNAQNVTQLTTDGASKDSPSIR